jgi:leader peptidase (prepilin peptidase)/N-methyltransferase
MSALSVFHIVISAMLGASLGSFFNVVAHRSVKGRPWWGKERSVCESCGKELTALELIPLVSWLAQRGRCRSCKALVSPRYVVVELLGAAAAGFMAWRWGFSLAYLLSMFGCFGILLNALTDYETNDVFDAYALAMGICGLVIRVFGGLDAFLDGLAGAAIGGGVFAALILMTKIFMGQDGMGWGDATFMAGLGSILGWKMTLLAFYAGIMAGGVGIVWLMLRGKVKWGRGDSVPLVPYLGVGGFFTLLCGPEVIQKIGARFQLLFLPGWPW